MEIGVDLASRSGQRLHNATMTVLEKGKEMFSGFFCLVFVPVVTLAADVCRATIHVQRGNSRENGEIVLSPSTLLVIMTIFYQKKSV